MSFAQIKNTAFCRWDSEDASYIVTSSIYDGIVGAGDTEAEAWQIFFEILEDVKESAHDGFYMGLDSQGELKMPISQQEVKLILSSDTADFIEKFSQLLEITQGQVVDFLAKAYTGARAIENEP